MSDTAVLEATPDPATPQNQDVAGFVSNPKILEMLAVIASEQHTRLMDADMQEALAKARKTVQNRTDVLDLANQGRGKNSRKQKLLMEPEQLGEWLKCTVRGDTPDEELDVDGIITQALNPSTTSQGEALVPDDWIPELEKRAAEPAIVWPLVNKRRTRRDTVTHPEVTGYITPSEGSAAKSSSGTTADELAETVPVFDELTWVMKYMDARVPVKLDLFDDSPLNVFEMITELVGDGFAIKRENLPLQSSAEPTKVLGVLKDGGITSVAIAAAPTLTNLLNFISTLPQRYRGRATMILPSSTMFKVIQVLAENVRAAEFLTKHLPPMKESAHCTEGKMIIGDWSRYVVYWNLLMRMVSSIDAERFTREIVFVEKWSGFVTIKDAFRIATGVTYT